MFETGRAKSPAREERTAREERPAREKAAKPSRKRETEPRRQREAEPRRQRDEGRKPQPRRIEAEADDEGGWNGPVPGFLGTSAIA